MKIGFFDSGLGGLTILKAVAKALPQYDYMYYGDTANVPYGDKSEEEIFALTKQAVEYLFDHDCVLVIAACNTVSVSTVRKLQDGLVRERYSDRKILGVVVPTVEVVCEAGLPDRSTVVLLGTTRTVHSGKYPEECDKRTAALTIMPIAMPELVPLIESGHKDEAVSLAIQAIDTVGEKAGVILGCTHYTLLLTRLREYYGATPVFFSQDEIIPPKVVDYLERHEEIEKRLTRGYTRNIFLTDIDTRYDSVIAELLGGSFIGEEV